MTAASLKSRLAAVRITDIVAAGGSFVSGGYNTTLSGDYGNPLAGQQAWSGNSGGFTTTVVNLPAAAAGQNIQLRWRCAAGNTPPSVTSSGTLAYWNFDASTPVPNIVATNVSVSSVSVTECQCSVDVLRWKSQHRASDCRQRIHDYGGTADDQHSCFTFSHHVARMAPRRAFRASALMTNVPVPARRISRVQISQAADFSSGIYDQRPANFAHGDCLGREQFPVDALQSDRHDLLPTLRLQAGASGGTWRIDNLNVQGSVTSGGSTVGSGWYVDSVSIQDAFCCTNFVNPPVADFTGSPTTGTAPLAVTFNDNSTGTISNWFWDFGDSSTTNVTTNTSSTPTPPGPTT